MPRKSAKPANLKKVTLNLKRTFRMMRDLRRAQGLSVGDLSVMSGVTKYMILRIEESGRASMPDSEMANPVVTKVLKLACALTGSFANALDFLDGKTKLPRKQGKRRK